MTEATGIIIINEKGQVLLQHRDHNAPRAPNAWGLWGGGLEAGEKPVSGAIRELKEELGIDTTINDVQELTTLLWSFNGREVLEHIFILRDHGQFTYVQGEGDDMRFFSKEDLLGVEVEEMTAHMLKLFFSKKHEH